MIRKKIQKFRAHRHRHLTWETQPITFCSIIPCFHWFAAVVVRGSHGHASNILGELPIYA